MSNTPNHSWIMPVLKDVDMFLNANGLADGHKALINAIRVIQSDIDQKAMIEPQKSAHQMSDRSKPDRRPYLRLVKDFSH